MNTKCCVIIYLLSLIVINSQAQNQFAIPYQAVVRDVNGNLFSDQTIELRISIIDSLITGPVVYQETHNVSTNSLGLVTLNIGTGTTIGVFDPVKWDKISKFVSIEMKDANPGSTFIMMGTQQLMSVPFALYAQTAGPSGAVEYISGWNAVTNEPHLSSSTGTKGYYYVVTITGSSFSQNTALDGINDWQVGDWAIYNGTHWEKVDNSGSISSASEVGFTPNSSISATNVQDAIEELQTDVDSHINTKVSKSGDTMTGDLILSADPTNTLGAATKHYVDSYGISSFIHRTDDGVSIYLPPGGLRKRFGIGDTAPASPLGIKGEDDGDDGMISFSSHDQTQKWNINLNPSPADEPGFSIDNSTSGIGISRFFIDNSNDGKVGLGTITPSEKLHIQGAADGDAVSVKIQNSSSGHSGWLLSHTEDNSISSRNGSFSIMEQDGNSKIERITILPRLTTVPGTLYNVGINEKLPYATLHVTRPASDPLSNIDLAENTGILLLGPIDNQNLAFDSHQIQARTGEYLGGTSTLSFTASALSLQPKGGDLVVHTLQPASSRVTISSDGKIGVGKDPIEKIDINGAIRIGDALSSNDGTIRYTGTDFEGRKGGTWVSLTSGTSISSLKADKVVGATSGNFATLDASGNLTDSGKRPSDFLLSTTTASGIPISPNGDISSTNVQSAIVEVRDDTNTKLATKLNLSGGTMTGDLVLFSNPTLALGATTKQYVDDMQSSFTSSYISKIDDGVSIYKITGPTGLTKRFGIGISTPACPLGIQAEPGGNVLGLYGSSAGDLQWAMRLSSGTPGGNSGFSFDEVSGTGSTTSRLYVESVSGKVGIGTSQPVAHLHVVESNSSVSDNSLATLISNSSSSAGTPAGDERRVGLEIQNTGSWSSSTLAKNVGLYISNVSGQSNLEANIAAIMNGNVVIGSLSSSSMVGTGGSNVLAIQNGVAPSSAVGGGSGGPGGTTLGGIQIFSDDVSFVSTFSVMNGNGDIIRLYSQPAITTSNNGTVDASYGTTEAAVINNLRDRINDLENRLSALGLLH